MTSASKLNVNAQEFVSYQDTIKSLQVGDKLDVCYNPFVYSHQMCTWVIAKVKKRRENAICIEYYTDSWSWSEPRQQWIDFASIDPGSGKNCVHIMQRHHTTQLMFG